MADDSLVAPVEDSHTWLTGNYLWDDTKALIDAIESGDWKDQALAGTVASLDLISVYLDPIGSLTALGASWLMEQVAPLKEFLDGLTGDADIIASHVQTWRNIGEAKLGIAEGIQSTVEDLDEWTGVAADAYREKIEHGVNAAIGLAGTAYAMAAATEAAGILVATTRDIVRDIIAEAVATLAVRVPLWLAEEGATLGAATPVVLAQVAGFVSGVLGRLISYGLALQQSLRALKTLLEW